MIAEQFGTLATLYPGRIDLGLGRAPGTDQMTMRALHRTPRQHKPRTTSSAMLSSWPEYFNPPPTNGAPRTQLGHPRHRL